MIDDNEMKEILPEKPRKIDKDLPTTVEILSREAKLSKDSRNQYFLRFPREVAEALGLEKVDKIEFNVSIQLPDGKPEDAELTVRLIRK